MAVTIEQRAAALLRRLLDERGTTVDGLARRLGASGDGLRRMLAGEDDIELDRLDAVLTALDVGPAEFFGRLYGSPEDVSEASRTEDATKAGAASPAGADTDRLGPEDEPITRQEVEEVLGELRSTIRGMVRLIDAERESSAGDED